VKRKEKSEKKILVIIFLSEKKMNCLILVLALYATSFVQFATAICDHAVKNRKNT
jgi:hypothetical protein